VSQLSLYVGRTVDLLAFQGQKPKGDVLLSQVLVQENEGGEICTGVQKLTQRWLIEFFTATGSLLYLPARGCPFMVQLLSGQLHTTLDVQQAFYLSLVQIKTNLQSEETVSTPADESYGSVTLNEVLVTGDTVQLTVGISSEAGDTAVKILPINVRTD